MSPRECRSLALKIAEGGNVPRPDNLIGRLPAAFSGGTHRIRLLDKIGKMCRANKMRVRTSADLLVGELD
jgi:hypothetical protein